MPLSVLRSVLPHVFPALPLIIGPIDMDNVGYIWFDRLEERRAQARADGRAAEPGNPEGVVGGKEAYLVRALVLNSALNLSVVPPQAQPTYMDEGIAKHVADARRHVEYISELEHVV